MSPRRLLDDCFRHDRDRLRHEEALALLRERASSVVDVESVPVGEAHGRILAEDVTSPRDVPTFDNAAVDGYAYRAADYEPAGGWFPVVLRAAAGHPAGEPLPKRGAARIFTGAPVPEGADTIAMQEDCEPHVQGDRGFVAIPPGQKPGANRRKAGEDLKVGDVIAAAGRRLRPQDLAALASVGAVDVPVFRRLRVAIASTGDEVARPGDPLPPGGVYDANHVMLTALLSALPIDVHDLGILPDDRKAVEARLSQAAGEHHAILTTGGASRGEEDHVVTAIDRLGTRHLWQLAVKPGRPMSFGQIGDAATVGLPGNPVAAFVCAILYVRPLLLALAGATWEEPQRFPLPADFAIESKPDRREFLRGRLQQVDGRVSIAKFPRDGSGIITGLRQADGLIEVPEDVTRVSRGDLVSFVPLHQFSA